MSRDNLETHWGRVSYNTEKNDWISNNCQTYYSYYKLMSHIFPMAVGCLTVSREFNLLCFNLFLKFQVCIYFMVRDSKKCYQKRLKFITEVYTLKTQAFKLWRAARNGERKRGKRTYKVLYSLRELSIWLRRFVSHYKLDNGALKHK